MSDKTLFLTTKTMIFYFSISCRYSLEAYLWEIRKKYLYRHFLSSVIKEGALWLGPELSALPPSMFKYITRDTNEQFQILTEFLLNPDVHYLFKWVDPDQSASEETNWSKSALFISQYVNWYQQFG